MELLDGTLKLRHCTVVFTMRFPPWSLPRVGNGGGQRQFVTPGHHSDPGGNLGKSPAYQEDTSKCIFSPYSGSWASNAKKMEKIAPPFLRRSGGVRWGVPRNLSPRLGVG